MQYKNELKALKKSNRFRTRQVFDESLVDLASNDYLGLSMIKELSCRAFESINALKSHGPKSSMLVNGYSKVHKDFEEYISKLNSFEKSIVVGSGYLANLALIESLVRKGDILILDEEYHASGIMASKLVDCTPIYFSHNNSHALKKILQTHKYKRSIVCVEGIYSMSGDLLNKEIFDVCDDENIIMIVDEAHSAGVIGEKFLGVFDHFNIKVKSNHIKMATLGKALGSYGAYIQASEHIISYLENRAKPIIYSTAPSLFDIALAHEGYKYIQRNLNRLKQKREDIALLVFKIFGIKLESAILKIEIGSNQKVLQLQQWAYKKGFLIGAIRPPTVKSAILRVILSQAHSLDSLEQFLIDLGDKSHHNTI